MTEENFKNWTLTDLNFEVNLERSNAAPERKKQIELEIASRQATVEPTKEYNFEIPAELVAYRQSLIPKWIKVFGWIFVAFSILVPVIAIYSAITSSQMSSQLYGLSYSGGAFDFWSLVIQSLFVFCGISAYGLLSGKGWGLTLCIVNGYVGVVICLYVLIMSNFSNIRLELLVQFFYLKHLHSIRSMWKPEVNQGNS